MCGAAWYQREITIPNDWTGRRIALSVESLNSFALVYIDGKKAGEFQFPSGEVDLTAMCHPGGKHVLGLLVVALSLKNVLLAYTDTNSANAVPNAVERCGLCGEVYLTRTPSAARITDVKVDSSFRQGAVTSCAAIDEESEQVKIFCALLDLLKQFPDYSLLHYGSYEVNALRRMKKHLPDAYQPQVIDAIQRSTNVLSIISPHIYFPTFSNSLKDLGHYVGCTWSDPSASGLQSIVWRTRWRQHRDESLKQKLVQYDLEDCLALRKLTDFIEHLTKERDSTSQAPAGPTSAIHTSTLSRPRDSRPVFKNAVFALEDFAVINERAYFDYQRDRVYSRSYDGIKKANRIKKNRRPASYRPNKLIEIAVARCPSCGSRKITPLRQLRLSGELTRVAERPSGASAWPPRCAANHGRSEPTVARRTGRRAAAAILQG
jgi:hypothetical protein